MKKATFVKTVKRLTTVLEKTDLEDGSAGLTSSNGGYRYGRNAGVFLAFQMMALALYEESLDEGWIKLYGWLTAEDRKRRDYGHAVRAFR